MKKKLFMENMRAMRFLKLILGILLISAFLITPALGWKPSPVNNCCFQIWAAGCNLGWSTSLMNYTTVRERWAPADQTIYNNIIRAGDHIMNANRECGALQAWPGWKLKRSALHSIATSLSKWPNSNNRRQLLNRLRNTYSWARPLRIAVYANRRVETDTCSEKYFKLGWLIGYVQQTLKIGDEALKIGRMDWGEPVIDAKNHMNHIIRVLYEYGNLRPITGRCVRIYDLDVPNRISELINLQITPYNLNYMVMALDWIWKNMQARISTDCPTPRKSSGRQREGTSSPEGHGRVSSRQVKICVIDSNKILDDHYDLYINNSFIGPVKNPPGGTTCYNAVLRGGKNLIELKLTKKMGKKTKLTISINNGEFSSEFRGSHNHSWTIEAPYY